MEELIKKLTDKDDKAACEFAKRIGTESAESKEYLAAIPAFAGLLREKSSFVRTRAFILICEQARWADGGEIEDVWDEMQPLLYDPKPTAVRQCLGALHEVVLFRPELSERIEKAVALIDPGKYKDSMSPLIEKDVAELRKLLE